MNNTDQGQITFGVKTSQSGVSYEEIREAKEVVEPVLAEVSAVR